MCVLFSRRGLISIEKIINDLGFAGDNARFKQVIMTLINLCYLVKSDPDSKFSEEEFSVIAGSILGMSSCLESKSREVNEPMLSVDSLDIMQPKRSGKTQDTEIVKQNFLRSIYKWVSSDKQIRNSESTIQQFFSIFKDMAKQAGSNFEYDFILVSRFKNFLMDITNKHKKAYLVKFDVEYFDPE